MMSYFNKLKGFFYLHFKYPDDDNEEEEEECGYNFRKMGFRMICCIHTTTYWILNALHSWLVCHLLVLKLHTFVTRVQLLICTIIQSANHMAAAQNLKNCLCLVAIFQSSAVSVVASDSCSRLTGVDPDAAFCCCSRHAELFKML